MKIVLRHIPFKGYKCMALYPFIIIRKEYEQSYTSIDDNHERIHLAQQKELLVIPFYILYLMEWLVKLFIYGSKAYYNISFEREAYRNEYDMEYIKDRRHYSWIKYLCL